MNFLTKIKVIVANLKINFFLTIWNLVEGDKKLRLDYDLNPDSLVLDVGGYLGDWSSLIYQKYKCKIFIFEPVKAFYKKILLRFQKVPRIKVFNFGLGAKDKRQYIYKQKNSSSFYKKDGGRSKEECKIVDIERFILNKRLKHINLIKVNIEGGEYDLLENIISRRLIKIFDNLQIQFHRFMPKAQARRRIIQNQLSKTHYLTYNYPFIWENWKKK